MQIVTVPHGAAVFPGQAGPWCCGSVVPEANTILVEQIYQNAAACVIGTNLPMQGDLRIHIKWSFD